MYFLITKLFQKFEKAMDINESTEEPQLVHAKVTGDMTREEVVEMVLKTLSPDEQDGDKSQVKLLDGYYKPKQVTLVQHWKVDGDKIECEDPYNTYDFRPSFEYGDFGKNFLTKYMLNLYTSSSYILGEADEKIVEKIGKCRYNMVLKFFFAFGQVDENGEIQQMEFKDYGVIVDGGNKVYVKGFTHYEMDKITNKEFENIANDYDDIEAPPGPYKIQPEKKGMDKILFLLMLYANLL